MERVSCFRGETSCGAKGAAAMNVVLERWSAQSLLSAPTSLPAGSNECPGAKRGGSRTSHGSEVGGEEGSGGTWLCAVAPGWCSPYETYEQR